MPSSKRQRLGSPEADDATNGSHLYSPFEIPFNPEPLKQPRKLRVVCVGAGFAGLTLAYKIIHERKLEHIIDFQIYERNHDVGGTWLVNKYPGLTCDVPIHIYTLPWAPKHDWNRYMATGSEILKYVREVSAKFGLQRCIEFNTSVKSAIWNDESGKWKLHCKSQNKTFDDECDILIGAVGPQNTPLKSAIPGINNFKGPVLHTGQWDESVDCHGKRIAVIGNGSSGIQCFGALQKQAAQITHYIRSPTWISLNYLSQFTRNADGRNFDYTEEEKATFLKDPQKLYDYRRTIESSSNGIFKNLVFDETAQGVKKAFRAQMEQVMEQRLNGNQDLISKLTPRYQPWCRRLTPGDGYLEALQELNARLVDDPIECITETGIRTTSGDEVNYDILIAATGYVNSRVVPWKMIGSGGVDLAERFKDDADGYISVAAPSMPNYFSIGCGPNFTIANGPVLSAHGFMSDYVLQWLLKIGEEDIHSVCVKDDVVLAYNIYIQQVLRRTAWNRECESWYKKGRRDEYRTGITAIYPGSMMHFKSMLEKIRPEDFEIRYRSNNPFKFFGCGLTARDVESDQPDLSWYLKDTMKLENMM